MQLLSLVRLLEKKSEADRRKLIADEIAAMELSPIIDGYKFGDYHGDNIMVTLPGAIREKVIIAVNTDIFPGSPGANDNASGCAVALDVLRRLKETKPKFAIKFIFFDQEQDGRKGSQGYISRFEINNVIAVLNPKMVGVGDCFICWDVNRKTKNSPSLAALRASCKSLGTKLVEIPKFTDMQSDFKSFVDEEVDSSLAFASIPCQQVTKLMQFVKHPYLSYLQYKLGAIDYPKIFKRRNNALDSSQFLSEESLQLSSEMLYRAVQYLVKM